MIHPCFCFRLALGRYADGISIVQVILARYIMIERSLISTHLEIHPCYPAIDERQSLLGLIMWNLQQISSSSLHTNRASETRKERTICPAPSTVAYVKPPALLVLPALVPSTSHTLRGSFPNSSFPLQSSPSVHRSFPTQLQIQSYVPA